MRKSSAWLAEHPNALRACSMSLVVLSVIVMVRAMDLDEKIAAHIRETKTAMQKAVSEGLGG